MLSARAAAPSSSSASRLLLRRAASLTTAGARRPPITSPTLRPPPSWRRRSPLSSHGVVVGYPPRGFPALHWGCWRDHDLSTRFLSTHADQHQDDEDWDDAGYEYDDEMYSSPAGRISRSRTGGFGGDGYRRFSGGGGRNRKKYDSEVAILRTALLDAPLGSLSRKDVGNSAHRLVRSSLARGDIRGAEDVLRRAVRERDFHLGRLRSGRHQGARAVADEDNAATDEDSGSAAVAAGDTATSEAFEDDDTSITYIKPILFHLVMDGWAKCSSDGSSDGSAIDSADEGGSNNAITPFDAARRAEQVFDLMKGNAGDRGQQPQTAGYNILISAWSRAAGAVSGDPDARFRAAERAESFLRRMQESFDSGDDDAAAPDAVSYGAAIDAWANFAVNAGKHPKRNATGRRAEALLRDAMERYNAHEKRGRAGGSGDLLDDGGNGDDTKSRSSPPPPPPPDARCFTGVIRAHSHSHGTGQSKSAEKCEELLRRLVRFRDSISPDSPHFAALAPDPTLFAAVISAHANRARFDPTGAPRSAEDVFRLMVDLGVGLHHHHDEDNGHRETSSTADGASYAFNAVLRAYSAASTKDAEAAFRAERFLNETLRDPDLDWIVDTVSFNTVLHALSRSRAVGAPERAESILNFMERRSIDFGSSGDGDGEGSVILVRPDVTSYSSVINAFARGRCDPGAGADAGADDGGTGSPSSDDSLDAEALARYRIDKALGIMDRLEGWHRSSSGDDDSVHHEGGGGGSGLKPNAVAYTSVINACAYAYPSPPPGGKQQGRKRQRASHAAGRGEAYETARSILDRCRETNEVDHIVYSTMLVACRNLLPSKSAIRREEVERLVEECKWDGFLSASVVEELARLLKVSSSPGNKNGGETEDYDEDSMLFDKLLGGYGDRVCFVSEDGKKKKKKGGSSVGGRRLDVAVDVRDFPPEWSRHVRRDSRHRRSATGQL